MYELEMTIITAIWSMEKMDLDQFKKDMFRGTSDLFSKIACYRKDGNPAGDIVITNTILGADTTKLLMSYLPKVIETSLPRYIRELSIMRYKEKLMNAISENTLTPELLDEGILVYRKDDKDGNLYDLSGDLQDYVQDLEKRIRKDTPFYELGFKQLDEWISPLEAGMFLIVKAIKKTGKTNFAMKLFCNMLKKNIPCLYLTSEMGYFKLIDKAVAITGSISAAGLRKGDDKKVDITKVNNTITTKLAGKKSYIYQSGMFDMNKIAELITKTGVKIVFIDYLQMFHVADDEKRASSLEKIACQIKDIAMTRGIVAIGMSQVNKEGDTKHCLSFEEKADQVISLKTRDDTDKIVKTMDATVEFNRFGESGTVSMVLVRSSCDMAELDERYKDEKEEPKRKEEWYNK